MYNSDSTTASPCFVQVSSYLVLIEHTDLPKKKKKKKSTNRGITCSYFANSAFRIGLSKMACVREKSSLVYGKEPLMNEQLYLLST